MVQTSRSTGAAVIAYLIALWLIPDERPLLAPLTAILVVQVTLYATLTVGLRRIVSVVAGVLLALTFAALLGFSWWSLGILIAASLSLGRLLQVFPFVEEVAISGMLVLGVGSESAIGLERVLETLVGAAVGVLINVIYAPPVFVRTAGGAVETLARRMQRLLAGIGPELREGATPRHAAAWMHEAREIDQDILLVDGELSRAEESLRLNPRARRALHTGMALRSGLDTLEHCTVSIRSLCRSLAELLQEQDPGHGISREELASTLDALLGVLGRALSSFGQMLSAEVTAGADRAETELADALARAHTLRARIEDLLLLETDKAPETWQLHGTLLKVTDRLLDEMDLEKRVEQRLIAYSAPQATLRQTGRSVLDTLRSRMHALRDRILPHDPAGHR